MFDHIVVLITSHPILRVTNAYEVTGRAALAPPPQRQPPYTR